VNKIEGRVTVSDSNVGVPGLIVTLYDARLGSLPGQDRRGIPEDLDQTGSRLVSDVAREGGQFSLGRKPRP
jgi:hypothetical protein